MTARKLKPARSVQLLERPSCGQPGVLLVQLRGRRKETSVYFLWPRGHLVFGIDKVGHPGHCYRVQLSSEELVEDRGSRKDLPILDPQSSILDPPSSTRSSEVGCSCPGWRWRRGCRHWKMLTQLREKGQL
jgi:hypothetical protein